MADEVKAQASSNGENVKKGKGLGGFLKSQLMDIQFTNPFTGAVHNLMNVSAPNFKNLFKRLFYKPVTSASFKHDHLLPIEDVIDALATVLNTTFYGFEEISNKMAHTRHYDRNYRRQFLSKLRNKSKMGNVNNEKTTKNGMDTIEFAKMCKKCPVKLHKSGSPTNYKEVYWTILEPEQNMLNEFKGIFGTAEKILLLYWNDTVNANVSKFTDGIESLLANLTTSTNKQIIKISVDPESTENIKSGSKIDKKEKEDLRRAEQMARRKKYGLTANNGQFSFEPTIVENLLQAKKEGVKWIMVFRDVSTTPFNYESIADATKDEKKNVVTEEEEFTANDILLGNVLDMYYDETNEYDRDTIGKKLKNIWGTMVDKKYKEKLDDASEKLKNIMDKITKAKEDERNETDVAKKNKITDRIKRLEKERDKFTALISKIKKDKAEEKSLITMMPNELKEKIKKYESEKKKITDEYVHHTRDKTETINLTRELDAKINNIQKLLTNTIGQDRQDKMEQSKARSDNYDTKNNIHKKLIGVIGQLDITKSIIHAICDIREMEKTLDDKDILNGKKLDDKMKNIKSNEDFQLGLTYEVKNS